MGLLDDLRNQAQGQRTAEKENAERLGDREQHYRELMLPRMVRAYQYFKELTDHLNYIKFDTVAEYPLYANGATQPMHQKGYAVRIDSSKELKQIDITFQCVLESPITFELYNRDTILNHSEKLDRYFVKYERTDKKNNKLEVVASSFTITGPLPLKIGLTANIANSDIRIAVRNFTDPGTNTYTIKTEEFDDAFLDKLGKYMLRKEPSLMLKTPASAEMSQEAKAQLREKILREQKLREQELREAEEQERLAEEQRRQNTAKAHLKKAMNEQTDHLKKAVNTQIEQKKEMFKGMFDKLKNQAASVLKSEPKNTVPAQQAAQQSVSQPPLQTRPRTDASITNTGQRQPIPRTPVPPGQSQMAAPSARIESSRVSPGVKAPAPANAAPKQQAPAQPTAPTERRQTQPPKIFNASPDNPFTKPEPPEPVEPQEQAEATVAPEASATPAPVKLEANAIPAQVKPDVNTTAAAPVKPELTMTPAPVKPEANATAAPVKPEPGADDDACAGQTRGERDSCTSEAGADDDACAGQTRGECDTCAAE